MSFDTLGATMSQAATAEVSFTSYNERVAARRKLAIGLEILEHGPITGTRMLGITREIGLPASSAGYPNTLRQFGFLEQVPGRPVRWKVSAKGEAWVRAQSAAAGV